MDITAALAPNSDQLDAVELVTPRTFTIDTGSGLGTREGKAVAEIRLVDFPRVWRPSKGMLDVLAKCWGTDARAWAGRRVTLYCDPEVTFGKEKPGGVRISHLSHIDKARDVTIRGRGAGKVLLWHVEPLPDAPAPALATDRINKAVAAFASIGVDQARLETALGPDRNAWDIDALLAAYTAIKNGGTTVDEAFPTDADTTGGDDQ